MSGSYGNYFQINDLAHNTSTVLQADKSAFKSKRPGSSKSKLLGKAKPSRRDEFLNADALDFNRKILHASWHPRESTIALAATNNLFLFSQV